MGIDIMQENISFTKDFEVLQQEQTDKGYVFGGYILTFDSELLGHKLNVNSDKMKLDKNAEINFRKDSNNDINLPLTIDHGFSVESVRGNFFDVFTDHIGVFGRANTTNTELADKIKDRTLRNLSSEVTINKFDTREKVDFITEALFTAVSIVSTPADAKANIREFSVNNDTKIITFSDILKNLGMSNKESNTFISKFKEFLLTDKSKEVDLIKSELNKYKLLERLRNGGN